MPVRINSGQTIDIQSGETRGFDDVANAGTIKNAGTSVDIAIAVNASGSGIGEGFGSAIKDRNKTTVASGVGRGVGSATTNQFTNITASGAGLGIGAATATLTVTSIFGSASGVGRGIGQATTATLTDVSASGAGLGIGTALAQPDTKSVATGFGDAFGEAAVITADYIRSGTTINTPRVISDGFDDIQNAGTVTNAGEIQDVKKEAIALPAATNGFGSGIGDATTTRFNNITASGAGLGVGDVIEKPFRNLLASGVGLGVGGATTDNFRDTSALGSGLGIGTARKPLPFDPVAQIIRLLEDTNDSCFRYDQPERIDTIWEYSHNDRINFRDAAFYLYTPTDASIDKFSIDGDNFNQTVTIEVLVMTLDQQETSAYLRDLSRLIAQLYDDNTEESTLFHRFGNISAADLRNEHITQQSDHYIGTVTFEVQQFNTASSACFK